MSELTVVEALATLLKEWRRLSKPKQRDLLKVLNKKHSEIEAYHYEFMDILRDLEILITQARDGSEQLTVHTLQKRFQEIFDRRWSGRQVRLAHYEEAKVYSEEEFANRFGLLKTIPRPVVATVKIFMSSYARYFEFEHHYNHEVFRVMDSIDRTLDRVLSQAARESELAHIYKADLDTFLTAIRTAQQSSEASWMRLSRDYYRAYATFADHGVFLADTVE